MALYDSVMRSVTHGWLEIKQDESWNNDLLSEMHELKNNNQNAQNNVFFNLPFALVLSLFKLNLPLLLIYEISESI